MELMLQLGQDVMMLETTNEGYARDYNVLGRPTHKSGRHWSASKSKEESARRSVFPAMACVEQLALVNMISQEKPMQGKSSFTSFNQGHGIKSDPISMAKIKLMLPPNITD